MHRQAWGKFFGVRKHFEEGQESGWWFAAIAIPLLAATFGPMANVLSIGALVTYWRMDLLDGDGNMVGDLQGVPFADPRWCYWLNAASLIFGFVGNFFLLLNFTQRIRYLIALPMTIMCWYLATGLLTGVLVAMNIHVPPERPIQTYTQGYWYGVSAAVIYLICSVLLMINMLGHFRGHYPDTFTLSDHQRTLILQTMLFFIWLAGGGAVFSRIESDAGASGWSFVDGLYFCDVTILTVGFGDLAPQTDLGRGLVFPFSVGGIIMLGLVIASIHKFAGELGEDKIIKHHFEKVRLRTWDRTVSSSMELKREEAHRHPVLGDSADLCETTTHNSVHPDTHARDRKPEKSKNKLGIIAPVSKARKPKLIVLREEKDRFDAMRKIQRSTNVFKRWWALSMSILAFGILWVVGAIVFWQAEKSHQGMTYFQALYFCYVSLLTIGYGDLSPKSNPGRCFFVVWSLIAVPTMTVLISDMGDTVISNFRKGFDVLADFTVLPQAGRWRNFLDRHPWLLMYLQRWVEEHRRKRRIKDGIPIGPPDGDLDDAPPPTIEALAAEAEAVEASGKELEESELAKRLALAIRRAAIDMNIDPQKRYNYEEWVEFTRLIRFTTNNAAGVEQEEEVEGLVEWDWIGEDSPMMAKQSEPHFVLDRLCESLVRYIRKTGDIPRTGNVDSSTRTSTSGSGSGSGRAKGDEEAR